MIRPFLLCLATLVVMPSFSWAASHHPRKAHSKKSQFQLRREAKIRQCMEGLEPDHSTEEVVDPDGPVLVEAPGEPKQAELDYVRSFGWPLKRDTGYVNKEAFPVTLVQLETYGGHPVELKTAIAFDKMARAARRKGVYLSLNSGFRTQEEQKKLRLDWCSHRRAAIAAVPGRSLHQAGYALDINIREKSASRWLNKHGHDFHFYRTVCSEPWHWEYSPTGEPLPMRYSCISKRTRARIQRSHQRANPRSPSELVAKQQHGKTGKKTT